MSPVDSLEPGSSGEQRAEVIQVLEAICPLETELLGPTTVENILDAATQYLHPVSAQEMTDCIREALQRVQEVGSYAGFRARFYEQYLRAEQCDSRETIPVALALFALAEGKSEPAILSGANFGRDADTIATMVGGLCGAYQGAASLPSAWRAKVEPSLDRRYRDLTAKLADVVRQRAESAARYADIILS